MAKAIKLTSGRWRCQVFDYKDDAGKIHRKSFTADTRREAERLAAMWQSDREETKKAGMTLEAAMVEYVNNKNSVLSPGTVKTYKGYIRNHFVDLKNKSVSDITAADVQKYINRISKTLSPKTVYNVHGFIFSVLREYNPSLVLNTSLPQKVNTGMDIPTKADVKKLLDESEKNDDKTLYLAILLASHLGLRRGEVCALDWSDLDLEKREASIDKAITITPDNTFTEKAPKSYSGYRKVPIPTAATEKLKQYQSTGKIIAINPAQLTNRWRRLKTRLNMEQYSYHNLRHYYASVMLDTGVPDKYAMEIMGHATNKMLRDVYQHVNDEKMKEIATKLDTYF